MTGMKGVMLPISTIIILILAVLVLVVLLVFFTTTSTPAMDIVMLKQQQAIYCSSYQQNNPDCDSTGHTRIEKEDEYLIEKLGGICLKLNTAEGGYPSCTGEKLDYACATECCRMYCGGETTTTT